jgi:hypothetical protein
MKLAVVFTLVTLPFTSGPVDSYSLAPVYMHAVEGVLERSGSYAYKMKDGYPILYCIRESEDDVIIQCIVHTPSDRLILSDRVATEHGV